MIEFAMIFSKESKSAVLSANYGDLDPDSPELTESVSNIKDIAVKLEKGVFNLDLDLGLTASIIAIKNTSIAIVFNKEADKKYIKSWESVGKEIISGFEKVYTSKDTTKIMAYKDTMNEIIEWHLKEKSPLDKMKDAFW